MKIRLWNPGRDCVIGDTSNVLNYCERPIHGKDRPRCFEIKWIGATQAGEELGTAATSVKDGTTTPFQITVVSDQANDTDAATGDARKVALIGVTVSSVGAFNKGEKPKLTVEVVNLNGTSDVLSSRWYLRIIHAFVCDHGSAGADAVGNITIESPANTTLITIAATYNESDSCVLYFAEGDWVLLDKMAIDLADATIAAGDGVYVTVTPSGFEHALNTDDELAAFYYHSIYPYGYQCEPRTLPWISPLLATSKSSLTFTETLVANSQTYCITSSVRLLNKAGQTYY